MELPFNNFIGFSNDVFGLLQGPLSSVVLGLLHGVSNYVVGMLQGFSNDVLGYVARICQCCFNTHNRIRIMAWASADCNEPFAVWAPAAGIQLSATAQAGGISTGPPQLNVTPPQMASLISL